MEAEASAMQKGMSSCGGGATGMVWLATSLAWLGLACGAAACPAIPAPMHHIEAVDFVFGNGGTFIDPVLRSRNDAVMEPLRTFVRVVSASADRFVAEDKIEAAQCALLALGQWAGAGAMLEGAPNPQSERERLAALSGLGFAYLKIEEVATADDRGAIEPWLDKIAADLETRLRDPSTPANLRLAWAGLAAAAVGTATGNDDHRQFATTAYQQALDTIDDRGVLPAEMEGGERALYRENLALGALVMTAEIVAKKRGEDWYARRDGAIHRLVDRVLDGLHDPSWFAKETDKSQFLPTGRDLAWIAFYARRFPARFAGRVPDGAIFQSPKLGGDLAVLAEKWLKD